MPQELILSVSEAMVTFGGKSLFENLSFNLHKGDRICLVGRNGAGKSTMMKVITGDRELDLGERKLLAPETSIGYLKQDITPKQGQTVSQFIYEGLHVDRQNDEYLYMIDMVTTPLELNSNDLMTNLSGGQMRRACLAKALVENPDILLLDEPTNHLDLDGIKWLEEYLNSYHGTLLCISHDKAFLANVTNKIFWLDRGIVRVCPKGFKHFDAWSTMLIEQEERELARRSKIVAQEMEWANKGVKARVKRNVRRIQQAREERDKLKTDKSSYLKAVHKVKLPELKAVDSSRVISEFYNVSKKFVGFDKAGNESAKIILNDFSFRVMKGDKIGILGKNGSGKTSFLKMLIGEEKPDKGTVKINKNLSISYFDQKRSDLDEEKSLWQNLVPSGGDYVKVGEKYRHVCGYLKDFLFDPKIANDKVATLSGGQRNRLLLAKVLANPSNFLILDEPTNDLDMDTLEMLEETLSNYKGTMFVVSHDRDFLDQTVSQILAFEGNGLIERHIGGYSDYLMAKKEVLATNKKVQKKLAKVPDRSENRPAKLSYKLERELTLLPEKIENLELKIKELAELMSDPNLYTNNPEKFDQSSKQLAIYQQELEVAETRWLELESIR
jgi:ATP-binding cassette subfamily F protein uup